MNYTIALGAKEIHLGEFLLSFLQKEIRLCIFCNFLVSHIFTLHNHFFLAEHNDLIVVHCFQKMYLFCISFASIHLLY